MKSAKDIGKKACLYCYHVYDSGVTVCNHCCSPLEFRKCKSNNRSWALLVTAIILYFPANLLPILYTQTVSLSKEGNTIMGSIYALWAHSSYIVAGVIFFASIIIPTIKIFILLYLLIYQRPKTPPILQTKLYKFTHFIGRWSMIDVFVVALLSALINGKFATMTPGPGIFAFAAVVVLTMLATELFDIRIIWDNYRNYANSKN